jgi:hypothetical protein
MVSMSNMKYNAITQAEIEIIEKIPIPKDWIPQDARVEIEAKKATGYYTTGDVWAGLYSFFWQRDRLSWNH